MTDTLPVVVSRTPEEWANRIRPHLNDAVAGIIAAGQELTACKADVGHGGFLRTVELLEIGARTAQMFMAIASHPALTNTHHGSHLPLSWRTLYELSRLPEATLERAIEAGEIRPDLERKAAMALVARYLDKGGKERPARVPSPEGTYAVLYCDPPWRYEHAVSDTRSIERRYPTMDLDELKTLDVPAADDAVLFLWATSPKLAEAQDLLYAWAFDYRTCMVWVKDRVGMGYYVRQQHELLLIARRGNPEMPAPETRPSSVLYAPRGSHSEKPVEMYELIERMYPEASKVELFARQQRLGWDAWGNEALGEAC